MNYSNFGSSYGRQEIATKDISDLYSKIADLTSKNIMLSEKIANMQEQLNYLFARAEQEERIKQMKRFKMDFTDNNIDIRKKYSRMDNNNINDF